MMPALLLKTFAIGAIFFICSSADDTLFRNQKQAEFLKNEVKEYSIIRPYKVNSDGTWISHDVRHFFDIKKNRMRREVQEPASVYYNVPLGQTATTLQLNPSSSVLGPGLILEKWRGKQNLGSIRNLAHGRHCLYRGTANTTSKSSVAITTCHGLTGIIRTGEEEFFIEPLKGHDPGHPEGHPHVIYKRSALQFMSNRTSGTCGVRDTNMMPFHLESSNDSTTNIHLRKRRAKRSYSAERNVETLVVADKMMVDYYSEEDIETYILTVINMVSTLYHDSSIGNAINIILVRIVLLESEENEDHKDLSISQHADSTLKSFCKWQKFINPKDEKHPNHHDVAILLTRYNICTRINEPCSTLGLAEVAGMCQPHRSCNVNEDTGLALAYTIAHEMGHNFGMNHDGPQNGCPAPVGEHQHVMSPHLNSDTSPFIWSNCSRNEITKFLDRDWGKCLDDEPSEHEFTFPELPAGAMYDANHQCRLQYGPEAEHCDGIEDVCQTLWCRQSDKCVTRLEPAAEGTLCGRNMWCYMGKCTTIGERPASIDGEWGNWMSWSPCSRSCGAGVKFTERHCVNPMPSSGGRYCIGERKKYKICNTQACPDDTPGFRAMQCSKFDSVPYKEELHTWIPVSTPMTPCQLHCKPKGHFFSVMLADTVEDGTRCNPGTRDVCINGKCRHVACDWVIDSKAQEDRCGVCHGDGTGCLVVRGKFDLKLGLGYVEVVRIPKGARNIKIEELGEATNYLAVQSADRGEFYLNGRWFIQWSGEYRAAGTLFYYQRDGEKESLHAPGPTREELRILLLYQVENPGIIYEYTTLNKNVTRKPEFHWEYTDWTVCSATCGGGIQVLKPKCYEKEAGLVEDKHCDKRIRPSEVTKICNKHNCPAKWWAGPWQHCSATCGPNGVRKRTVICVRSLAQDEQIVALPEEECSADDRPPNQEPCHNKPPCTADAVWSTGQWSDVCSKDPCSYQSRRVYCSQPNGKCKEKDRPASRRKCANVTCGIWITGNWSECSENCGGGTRHRNVSCQEGLTCHKATQPSSTSVCNEQPCSNDKNSGAKIIPGYPDEDENVIPTDVKPEGKKNDVIFEGKKNDVILHKHRHNHGDKKNIYSYENEVEQKHHPKINSKKPSRPRGVAKDIIELPMYEIEDSKSKNNSLLEFDYDFDNWLESDDDILKPKQTKIKKAPAIISYVFEGETTLPKANGKKYHWKIGQWSKCSVQCDEGVRQREVTCLDSLTQHTVDEKLCILSEKPRHEETCGSAPCLKWISSEWSQCSVTCGSGIKRREVLCPVKDHCSPSNKPSESMPCSSKSCTDWVVGPFSHCSATCGGGFQIRHVKCVNLITEEPSLGCDMSVKPEHRQACNSDPCPEKEKKSALSQCEDKIDSSMCKSLRHMCNTWYFKVKCCITCGRHRVSKTSRKSMNRGNT